MYTQNDGAWIKNVAEEARLIDAMRKGADLTVKGTSTRGTQLDRHLFAQGPCPGDGPRRAGVQIALSLIALLLTQLERHRWWRSLSPSLWETGGGCWGRVAEALVVGFRNPSTNCDPHP